MSHPPMPAKEIRTRLRTSRGPYRVETERETFPGFVVRFAAPHEIVTFRNEDTGEEVPCFVGAIRRIDRIEPGSPFAPGHAAE
jgi:hypothetical protein